MTERSPSRELQLKLVDAEAFIAALGLDAEAVYTPEEIETIVDKIRETLHDKLDVLDLTDAMGNEDMPLYLAKRAVLHGRKVRRRRGEWVPITSNESP